MRRRTAVKGLLYIQELNSDLELTRHLCSTSRKGLGQAEAVCPPSRRSPRCSTAEG